MKKIVSKDCKEGYECLIFWVYTEEEGERLAKRLNVEFNYDAKYVGLYQQPMRDHCVKIVVSRSDVFRVKAFVDCCSD